MRYGISVETILGHIVVMEEEGNITEVFFMGEDRLAEFSQPYEEKATPLLKKAKEELLEYAQGKRRDFDLPLNAKGTEFQKKVWKALCTIPYGEIKSYKQIAEQVGCPRGYRAVGMANHNNPISIIIPCHRVVGADGSLTGYGGGLERKQQLLELERNVCVK